LRSSPKGLLTLEIRTADWSADGHYFYGDVETNLLNSDSVILRVALTCQGS
jgi:hypothetical protein